MFRRPPRKEPEPPVPEPALEAAPTPVEVPAEGLDDEDFPDPFDMEVNEEGAASAQQAASDLTPLDVAALPATLRPARARVRPWVWWSLGGLLGGAALAASWLAWPVRTVTVSGLSQLSETQVRHLAGLHEGFGWLYYGKGRASGLLRNPWVQSAVVTKKFPDQVDVVVTERRPFLQMVNREGTKVLIAQDGRLLPWKGGFEGLPSVSGWGPERLPDAVLVARALSRYTVQSVAYTPSGLTVKTASGTVWSGDLKSLLKYAGSISMYPNQKINVYPWGVSVQ